MERKGFKRKGIRIAKSVFAILMCISLVLGMAPVMMQQGQVHAASKEFKFIKIDAMNGSYLSGAVLKIEKLNDDGTTALIKRWESKGGKNPAEVQQVIPLDNGKYRLTEESTPEGYWPIDPVEFNVTDMGMRIIGEERGDVSVHPGMVDVLPPQPDWHLKSVITMPQLKAGADIDVSGPKVDISVPDALVCDTMDIKNFKPVPQQFSFGKTTMSGAILPGAKLRIEKINDDNTTTTVSEWTSGETRKIVELTYGKYRIIEESAPEGYKPIDPVEFKVNNMGMSVVGKKRIDIVVYPRPIDVGIPNPDVDLRSIPMPQLKAGPDIGVRGPRVGVDLPIILRDAMDIKDMELIPQKFGFVKTTSSGAILPGATLKIEKLKDDNTVDPTFEAKEWISTEETPWEVVELTHGKYRIVEKSAPEGYKPIEPMVFNVVQEGMAPPQIHIENRDDIKVGTGSYISDFAGNIGVPEELVPGGFPPSGPDIDISLPKSDIDISLPKLKAAATENGHTATVNLHPHKADIDISGPKVSIDVPDVDIDLPKADIDISGPKVDIEGPDVNVAMAIINKEADKQSTSTPSIPKPIATEEKEKEEEKEELKEYQVVFSKQDADGKELAGASVEVKQGGEVIEQWVSKDTRKTIKLAPGTYTFEETKAPEGYRVAAKITFSVDKEGNVTASGTAVSGGNVVVMVDEVLPKEAKEVKFSKRDVDGNELKGATITVAKKGEAKVIETWVSDGTVHTFMLEPGDYVFKETAAPEGYRTATEIEFSVDKDGKVTSAAVTVEGGKENLIVMVDEALPKEAKEVKFSKRDVDGNELKGATITVTKRGEAKVIETWVSDGTVHTFMLEPGDYVFKETAAPEGYRTATEIEFSVDKDGKVTSAAATVEGGTETLIVMVDQAIPTAETAAETTTTTTATATPVVMKELPDANAPEAPDTVIIEEDGVPKTYKRIPNPDNPEEFLYILEEDVPLIAKTGTNAWMNFWMVLLMIFGAALVSLGYYERRLGVFGKSGK